MSKFVLSAACAALLSILPQSAWAQSAAASKPTALNAVTVTATKIERNVFDAPAAISVIGSDDIERAQAVKIDDVLKTIPNFDSAGGPRRISQEPSIRGLSDRRIVIKVDGMRRNFRAQYGGRYFVDPSLLDRIEISRGANSTLDGSGAVAGSIQMFTKDAKSLLLPGQTTGYRISSGFSGSDQDFNSILTTYGKQDALDYVASFSFRNSNDIIAGDDKTIADSKSNVKNYFLKTTYDAGSGSKLSLTASAYDDNSRLPSSPFQPTGPGNSPTRRASEQKDISAHYSYDAPDNDWVNVNAVVYHEDTDIDTRRYLDGRKDLTDFKTTGMDVFNTSNFKTGSVGHAWTYGVEIYGDRQSGKRNGGFRPLLGNAQSTTFGFYTQDEIRLSDRLSLTPGIRYDRYIIDPSATNIAGQINDAASPKLAANYIFTDAISGYASVAKAFRSPTITELYATGLLFPGNSLVSNPNLQPETAINKEIGIRYQGKNTIAARDNLRMRLSVFQNDVDDYIEQVIGPTTTQFRNDSSARLRGIEFESNYENLNYIVNFSAGFVRGENRSMNQPLTDVPPAKASLAVIRKVDDWDMNFGYRTQAAAAQDRIPSGQPLIVRTGGFMTHDLFLSWEPSEGEQKNMRVDFGVDNVFDHYYRRQLAFIPESGRTIKMNVSWKF